MSLTIKIDVTGSAPAKAARLRGILLDRTAMNERIGRDALLLVQRHGETVASVAHRSAESLGATPTGHLSQAYAAVQQTNDATSATLLVPRASRLRAAFGAYTVKPKNGSRFLTIPASAEAYGYRAGEFPDLFPIRSKAGKLLLCRKDSAGNLEPMFSLVPSATVPADKGLMPFDEFPAQAARSIEAFTAEQLLS